MYSQIAANKRKTVFALASFVLLVAALGAVFSEYLTRSLSLLPFVLAGAVIYALVSYYSGSSVALAVNGAKEIRKIDNPRMWRIVENLSITEGMPMPKVYVIDDPALNAFATGRDPRHAAICATTGLLEVMDDHELEGVLAHELGHIKNYDIRIAMIAFALVAVVSILSDLILRMVWLRDDDDNGSNNQIFLILGIVAAVIAVIVAPLIQLAISRNREYLADATGAMTTRYPDGLASALEKIAQGGSSLKKQNPSTAHLFFANPLKGKGIANLFSTHPPINERIARLREMGNQL